MCNSPYIKGGMAFGCGQCLPCRINKRREWSHRIELEARQYEDNAFVTLTYSDENLPPHNSLSPKTLQDWLKRLRKVLSPSKIRYFAVGEYGDETGRPHYHAALFGYPPCRYGQSRYSKSRSKCCTSCDTVAETWALGHVYLGILEPHSAAYICGYVTKKMTRNDDHRLEEHQHPEFARMSLRPGIGYTAMHELADIHLRYNDHAPDVPTSLRHGASTRPLGRYLSRTLRSMVGRDPGAPESVLNAYKEELHQVLQTAEEATSAPGMGRHKNLAIKSLITDANAGKRARQEARQKIFRPKRHL